VDESADSPEEGQTGQQPARGLRFTDDLIATLPVGQWDGYTEVIESEQDAERAVKHLLKERVLGFDTETRPSHTRGVTYLPSILQLAGADKIFIFRLDECGGVPVMFPLLCDARKAKVGVAVRDDVRHLQERAPFDAPGFLDVSDFTKRAGVINTGLRALAAIYLGLQMKKSKSVQCSHWELPFAVNSKNKKDAEFARKQIAYAANDAWFSRELFLKLEKDGIIPRFE
jgi:ribonuclease D